MAAVLVDLPVILIIENRLELVGVETPLMMLVAVEMGTAKSIASIDAARAIVPSLLIP